MHAISGLLDERSFAILEGYREQKQWSKSKALRELIKKGMAHGVILKELEDLQERVAECERHGLTIDGIISGRYDEVIKTFNQDSGGGGGGGG